MDVVRNPVGRGLVGVDFVLGLQDRKGEKVAVTGVFQAVDGLSFRIGIRVCFEDPASRERLSGGGNVKASFPGIDIGHGRPDIEMQPHIGFCHHPLQGRAVRIVGIDYLQHYLGLSGIVGNDIALPEPRHGGYEFPVVRSAWSAREQLPAQISALIVE